MARADMRSRFLELGVEPIDGLYGERFKEFATREMTRYAKLVQASGIRLE